MESRLDRLYIYGQISPLSTIVKPNGIELGKKVRTAVQMQ
jgi:hypothetical protein